jgi:hypothetical protein
MVIRTYFDRNNTIILDGYAHTGRNPVSELYYGGGSTNKSYSRFLFHFDETRLKNLHNGGTFPNLGLLKHTLIMTNTGAFDLNLLGRDTPYGKQRASSFDLVVFKLPQNWDEGVGYDYNIDVPLQEPSYQNTNGAGITVYSTNPSNWTYAQTNLPWNNGPGTYTGSPTPIMVGTQHFEQGNENLEIDITDIVNTYLTGATNYGLGIAFPDSYEQTVTTDYQAVGFFTRHTQTFYEPYVETTYSCHIKDDRTDFYLDKPNRIYLYVNINGTPTNLDELPTVNVYDNCGTIISSYTQNDIAHCTKGVYYIDLLVQTGGNNEPGVIINDIWGNIKVNGINRPDIELSVELKDSLDYYNIGDADDLPKKVGFNISGINHNEKIKRGDIRKVLVSTRIPYTVNQTQKIDRLDYRLYVKEGKNEFTVIDYQPLEMTPNTNYFLLDTASLIPNTYYLDVKYESNLEVSTNREVLKFDIISQVELRISQ